MMAPTFWRSDWSVRDGWWCLGTRNCPNLSCSHVADDTCAVADLGRQYAVPHTCWTRHPGCDGCECSVYRCAGPVRGADRRRGGHLGTACQLPAVGVHHHGLDAPV